MVKNAVIVPVGAKGGFVVKRPPAERDPAQPAEVRDVLPHVHPRAARRHRQHRRRRGGARRRRSCGTTATTPTSSWRPTRAPPPSPTSPTRWPPSTASGWATPSRPAAASGYDHKEMGITARARGRACGATSATRASTPTPPRSPSSASATCPATCSATACSSASTLRLVAAFDHRHVFLDPDPDPAVGVGRAPAAVRPARLVLGRLRPREDLRRRRRVAAGRQERSRCPPRSAPRSAPTPTALPPIAVLSLILEAPVDLLWNGGIGTYVKASAPRPTPTSATGPTTRCGSNGADLRCRVVGEGGNLGFTQRGRVEYALGGGLINTDAIDNSAGVDCSDHEVNIKILLDAVVAARRPDRQAAQRAARRHDRRGGRARAGATTRRRTWRWPSPRSRPARWSTCTPATSAASSTRASSTATSSSSRPRSSSRERQAAGLGPHDARVGRAARLHEDHERRRAADLGPARRAVPPARARRLLPGRAAGARSPT